MKKTALITGGSRGIGLGIARELADNGINIAINGVRARESVQAALDDLRARGVNAIYAQGDISKKGDRVQLLDLVVKEFGSLNILVNNAGIAPKERKDLLEATEESFDYVTGINLKGPYFLSQLVANNMIRNKKEDPGFQCCIINITSVSATLASPNRGEYCISKAGLCMMTKLFAARLGEFNIPVYEVQPGIIKTDMTSKVKEKYDKLFEEGIAIQNRWGLPEDVGKSVAALARGDMPYSSGQVIMVDGGLTIGRL